MVPSEANQKVLLENICKILEKPFLTKKKERPPTVRFLVLLQLERTLTYFSHQSCNFERGNAFFRGPLRFPGMATKQGSILKNKFRQFFASFIFLYELIQPTSSKRAIHSLRSLFPTHFRQTNIHLSHLQGPPNVKWTF